MLIIIQDVRPAPGFRNMYMISAERRPRWFEVWRMFTRPHPVKFLGNGSMWVTYPQKQAVPKAICQQLKQVLEQRNLIKRTR